jgi:apolipoprotein N-acyltransferase
MKRWRTHAAAVVSGLLFAFAFAPYGLTLLLPLALVPWLAALALEESRARALLSGFLFGLTYWCVSIPWIVYVVTHYGGQSAALGVVSLVLLASILAEWPALVAWGTAACAPARSGWRLAIFPLLWAASEHARSFVYGGFPWNPTGTALARRPIWIQSASVWGVYGVGFLVVAVAALLARSVVWRRPGGIVAAAAVVLAAGAAGAARLSEPYPAADRAPQASVALLQPNVTEEMRRAGGGEAAVYAQVLGQIRSAAAARPDLIVVPESAFPVYWQTSEALRRDLQSAARNCGCAVLFNDVDLASSRRYYNAARIVTPAGLVPTTYRKVHLVPFGEYVPLSRLFFFARQISTEIGEFSAASSAVVLRSPPFAIGMGVCYEILYPSLSMEEAAAGANLLATISNDSWYGRAGAQEQHFAGAVLRSVETGRYLVRAAITGISGIADDRGRIRAELPPGRAGILSARVRLLSSDTAWTAGGYWIPRVADAAGAGVLVFGVVRWIRSRRAAGALPRAGRLASAGPRRPE